MNNLTDIHRLTAPSSATILAAPAFASDLLTICNDHNHVVLDVEAVTQADISFVQLIYAARQYLEAKGGSFALAQPVGDVLAALLNATGISSEDSDAHFWFQGA